MTSLRNSLWSSTRPKRSLGAPVAVVCLFGWLVGFLTSSSTTTTRLYHGRAPRQSVWQFHMLPHMRQSWETMTSVSAGHIILTPTQPVGSARPQRESNPGTGAGAGCRFLQAQLAVITDYRGTRWEIGRYNSPLNDVDVSEHRPLHLRWKLCRAYPKIARSFENNDGSCGLPKELLYTRDTVL